MKINKDFIELIKLPKNKHKIVSATVDNINIEIFANIKSITTKISEQLDYNIQIFGKPLDLKQQLSQRISS